MWPGFIENRGQVDERVLYYGDISGVTVYFTRDAVVFDLQESLGPPPGQGPPGRLSLPGLDSLASTQVRRGCAVYLRFEGANSAPVVEAREALETRYNYFLGNDASKWRADVPAFGEVVYRDLWPGVDLVLRNRDGELVAEPVASQREQIPASFFRYEGADAIVANGDAEVWIETPLGRLVEVRAEDGERALVVGGHGRDQAGEGSPLSGRDDPSALLWSTFLGGSSAEMGHALALDASGNPVLTGWTESSNFPTTPGAYDTSFDGASRDVFVVKLSSTGNSLLWSTFLGGSSNDCGYALALDASGNPVLTGCTESSNFPATPAAYDTSFNGGDDVFIVKLSSSGSSLLWSTFLGGGDGDCGHALALDLSGNSVLTGGTASSNFPTTPGAYDRSYNGGVVDAFVAELSSTGSSLLWSTFLGGESYDYGYALALDLSGNSVLTGYTESSDFPATPGAYDTSFNGGDDVFIVKLSSSGSSLLWSTFLGGSSSEYGRALALDPSGNPVMTGFTYSSNFPTTPGAYDTSFNGAEDVFVAKLSSSGSSLLWSTFLGGSLLESGDALALDPSGNPVLTGSTHSSNFPTTPGAYDTSLNGSGDVFVTKLSSSGSSLLWSTFLGGESYDIGHALALDASENPVLTGYIQSSNFPTTPGAYDTSFNGGNNDAFIASLSLGVPTPDLPLSLGGLRFDGESIVPAGPERWRIDGSVQVGGVEDPALPLHLGSSSAVTVDLAEGTATVEQYSDLELHHEGHVFRLSAEAELLADPSTANPDDASITWTGRLYALGVGADLGIEGELAFRPNLYSLGVSGGSFFGLDELFAPGALLEFDGEIQLSQMCALFPVDVDQVMEIPIIQGILALPMQQSLRFQVKLDLINRVVEILLGGTLFEVEGTGGTFSLGCLPLPVCGGIRFPLTESGAPVPDLRVVDSLEVSLPIPIMKEGQGVLTDSSVTRDETPLSLGIDVKGAEIYEDLNCNAQYDLGEPFDDNVIQDGVWTDGSRIWLDEAGLNMQANATIVIGLLYLINIRAAQAEVMLDWGSETFEMSRENEFEMGPEEHPWFRLGGPLGDDSLRVVWGGPNREVRFKGELSPFYLPGITLRSEMAASWGPGGFGRLEGAFGADVRVLGFVDLALAETGFYVDQNGMEFNTRLTTPLFGTDISGVILGDRFSGLCATDFYLFGKKLIGGETRATIDGSCLTLDARTRLAGCMGVNLQVIWCVGWPLPRLGAGTGFAVCCPADLHYYDSQGRHVGRNPETGLIEIEIPGACYIESADHEGKYIGLPEMDWEGSSRLVVEALDEGQFDLSVMVPDIQAGTETFADYEGIAINAESVAELPFSTRADLNLLLDFDGDGQVDQELPPDSLVLADLDTSLIRIDSLEVQDVTPYSASIRWQTNLPADALVAYGQGEDLPDTVRADTTATYTHLVVLDGLTMDSSYRFIAVSADSLGRPARSLLQEFRTPIDASGVIEEEPASPPKPQFKLVCSGAHPVTGDVIMQLMLPSPGETDLEILDPGGRCVRKMALGCLPSGRQEIRWDGRDDAGRTVPSGMYIVRVTWKGRQETQRVILLD